jgi:uncharacterized protein (DUF1697 family)
VTIFVALLSAVNVGGRKAPSAELKRLCHELGWKRAETLLASGNIILDSGRDGAAKVKSKLEAAIKDAFGFDTTVILRTADELDGVLGRLPYKTYEPKLMLVNFLSAAPTRAAIAELDVFNKAGEDYVIDGAEMYVRYENGIADTKLTPPVIRRKLGVVGTGRNVNTVGKLRDKAREMERAIP